MNSDTTRYRVLVMSDEQDRYLRLLAAAGVSARAITAGEDVSTIYAGEEIVLGEPDRVVEALPALPGVRWVQSSWAGVLPLLEAASRGLLVTGVKDVFGTQMAEYALGYMLAHELDIHARHNWQQQGRWVDKPTGGLSGKTLLVMGTGSIGSEVARRASAFGMNVTGISRTGTASKDFQSVVKAESLYESLGTADFLVSVLPDTPETTGLLGREAFAAMPGHGLVINVGRGNVINEPDLLEALQRGDIGGAVLDVFNKEPLPDDHPFWTAPNLQITAHVAARSYPSEIAAIFLENYARYCAGEPLKYRVDPIRGY